MSNQKLVVFDLDGTLNRTELYAVPATKKALAELGIFDRTDEDIIRGFGARAQESVAALTGSSDPNAIAAYLKRYSQLEQEFLQHAAGSYDGVPEMLQTLKTEGYTTAICSNSSERYIRMVLTALDILPLIDRIQPLMPDMQKEDTLGLLLKREAPSAAVMVGDRIYDKIAARANKIPFIGCLYGFCSDEVADADAPVASARDIPAAVCSLIG